MQFSQTVPRTSRLRWAARSLVKLSEFQLSMKDILFRSPMVQLVVASKQQAERLPSAVMLT